MESICALGHERLAGAAQIVAVLRIRGPLTAARVRRALALLADRHPLLRARLERSPAGYRFTLAGPPPALAFAEEGALDGDWQAAEAREVAAPVDPELALWRTLLLRDPRAPEGPHTLLWTLHHAIADGLGVAALARQLLELCDADLRGAAIELRPRPLLPPAEALLSDVTGPSAQESPAPAPAPAPRPHLRPSPVAERRPFNVHRALAPERLAALHARARGEQTTVNAALAAAMLLAERRLGDEGPGALTTIVSLRGRCVPPVEDDAMGCYITSVRTALERGDAGGLWPLARAYRRAFAAAFTLPRAAGFDLAAASARFDPVALGSARVYPQRLGLTNLGALAQGAAQGAFTLEHFSFCTSRRAGFYVGFLHAVTLAGRLRLCFSAAAPLLARDWAEAFTDATVELLSQA